MQHLEVSGAVRHIYIYVCVCVCVCVVRRLKVKIHSNNKQIPPEFTETFFSTAYN